MKNFSSLQTRFDQDGYVFVPEFFNSEERLSLRQNIDRYIETIAPLLPDDKVFYEEAGDTATLKQMFDMSDFDPFFKDLLWNSKIKSLAMELLGENVDRGFVEYFNKPPRNADSNKEVGKPTPPHQDCYYFMLSPPQALTFWIPMEDVDKETGCLRYVTGSHKMGMRPHGRTQTLGFSQGIVDFGTAHDQAHEIAVPAKIGDVLAHHGMTIHRADGNNSLTRSRKVIGLVYFGESAKEDKEAKRKYQEQLERERKSV